MENGPFKEIVDQIWEFVILEVGLVGPGLAWPLSYDKGLTIYSVYHVKKLFDIDSFNIV